MHTNSNFVKLNSIIILFFLFSKFIRFSAVFGISQIVLKKLITV